MAHLPSKLERLIVRPAAVSLTCLAFVLAAAPGQAPGSGREGSRTTRAPNLPLSAQDLFQAVLRRYAAYSDFEARFVQTPASRATGEGRSESGMVYFKRPGMWRWEYLEPEKKVVVVRGGTATVVVEGDPEVATYELGESAGPGGVGSLLAGGEDLGRGFVATYELENEDGRAVLRLDPLELSEEFEYVLVRVQRRDLTILEVVVVDPGGNSLRLALKGLRAGTRPPEALFRPPLAPPPRP